MRPLTETELTQPGPGALKASAFHAGDVVRWMARVSPATSFLLPLAIRRRLLRLAGVKIGAQVTGLKQCGFETKRVSIGDGSFVNVGCWFEGAGRVDIGRNVFLGPQVMIITSIHELDGDGQAARMPVPSHVSIGDRCWLGRTGHDPAGRDHRRGHHGRRGRRGHQGLQARRRLRRAFPARQIR